MVALNLLYGYRTLLWTKDLNHRNSCPKITIILTHVIGETVNPQNLIPKFNPPPPIPLATPPAASLAPVNVDLVKVKSRTVTSQKLN